MQRRGQHHYGTTEMGARVKLNSAFIQGAVILAGLIGLVWDSVAIFVFCVLFFIASAIKKGEIR